MLQWFESANLYDGAFYDNDGKVGSHKPEVVQVSLDIFTDLFLTLSIALDGEVDIFGSLIFVLEVLLLFIN